MFFYWMVIVNLLSFSSFQKKFIVNGAFFLNANKTCDGQLVLKKNEINIAPVKSPNIINNEVMKKKLPPTAYHQGIKKKIITPCSLLLEKNYC